MRGKWSRRKWSYAKWEARQAREAEDRKFEAYYRAETARLDREIARLRAVK